MKCLRFVVGFAALASLAFGSFFYFKRVASLVWDRQLEKKHALDKYFTIGALLKTELERISPKKKREVCAESFTERLLTTKVPKIVTRESKELLFFSFFGKTKQKNSRKQK